MEARAWARRGIFSNTRGVAKIRAMSAERHRDDEARRRLASRRLLDSLGSGGLDEDEADEVALRAVRRARREAGRGAEEPHPSADKVRERRGSG
jgi:hypothetical protein